MKKVFAIAAVLVGLGVLARRLGPKMSAIDWEKRFEAMPDNAPPKWMFRNITAIRKNTDRILELLESGQSEPARQAPDEGPQACQLGRDFERPATGARQATPAA